MNFDLSKENIQPLRGGRNVSQLGVALQAQTNMDFQKELMQQKDEFERAIRTYTGDDPLENWYNYISWVEQSYPKHGHEGNLVPVLEHCLKIFEGDVRYHNDRRLCKLLIKFVDLQDNPVELFQMMYSAGMCRGCADMYRAWAYYHEAAGDFKNAHSVFELGTRELAQPADELDSALKNLIVAAGQHMLYGQDSNSKCLLEKRQALTSLRSYKHKVGSIRHASGSGPGTVGTASGVRSNKENAVYQDHGDEARGPSAPPISILQAAKRQEVTKENVLKPGTWTSAAPTKRHEPQRHNPGFTVHEDNAEASNDNVPFPNTTLENYSAWIVKLFIPEPKDDRMVPMYPKAKVYSSITTDISLEELRARRYLAKQNRTATIESETGLPSILRETSTSMEYSITHKDPTNFAEQVSPKPIFEHSRYRQGNVSSSSHCNEPNASPMPNRSLQSVGVENILNSPAVQTDTQVAAGCLADLWDSLTETKGDECMVAPKAAAPQFSIYEQPSHLVLREQNEPKGSAMKTPFKDLNAEELAETGSRGGMDVAAAAPVDSAKRLPLFDDDSSSPFKNINENVKLCDLSCNTQMFNFNLNAMQVSTPQSKQMMVIGDDEDMAKQTRKQLFAEEGRIDGEGAEKALSTILEETRSYGHSSSSSSSNATTKSSLFGNHTAFKQAALSTISEEHNNYLAQNLMANAALRHSLLADLMDTHPPSPMATSHCDVNSTSPHVSSSSEIGTVNYVPSDPFKASVIKDLLAKARFPGPHTHGYNILQSTPRLAARKESLTIGPDKYVIEKQLGRGTFGTVFRAVEVATGSVVALKHQKPVNKWEFYICRELQARLANHPLRERYMDVRIGYFSDQASILISEFVPYGSLLDVANTVKQKTRRSMKESLCIYFTIEMLKVVQAMHDVKIIHADIKPDNFLVQLYSNDTIGLQLIDFGCSIDMTLFPHGASFTRKVTTEDFICCEMLDGRPWNYHTDLFCIAATAHVLLFDKYIQMQKKDNHWSISTRIPRYARVDLWNMFFSTLLNQQSGPADTGSLQAMLDDSLINKFDEYHSDMRILINLLKNR